MELGFEVVQPGMNDLIPTAEQEKVKEDLTALFNGATIEVIETPEQLNNVVTLVQTTKAKWNEWNETRKDEVAPHNFKVDAINGFWNRIRDACKSVIANCEQKAGQYKFRLEEKERAEQRKRDEEARIKRLQFEEEARKKREEEDRLRREAEAKRKKAEETKNAETRKRLNDEAAAAEKKAEQERGKAEIKEMAAQNTVATVVSSGPTPKGLKAEYEYWLEITDPVVFMSWCVANGKFHFLLINEKILGKTVDLEKEGFKAPGSVVKKDIKGSIASLRKKKAA